MSSSELQSFLKEGLERSQSSQHSRITLDSKDEAEGKSAPDLSREEISPLQARSFSWPNVRGLRKLDPSDLQAKTKALYQVGGDSGGISLLHQVSPTLVALLLSRHSVRKTFALLQGVQKSSEQLVNLEAQAYVSLLKRILLAGDIHVMGRDIQDRPVIWFRTFTECRDACPNELTLALYWVYRWAQQLRRGKESDGVVWIVEDTRRRHLDFNLAHMKQIVSINLQATPEPHYTNDFYILCNKPRQWSSSIYKKMFPTTALDRFHYPSNAQKILPILQDPYQVPASFFPASGRPFKPSFEGLGNYSCLLHRKGFANMTLSSWSRPSASSVEELRSRTGMEPCISSEDIKRESRRMRERRACLNASSTRLSGSRSRLTDIVLRRSVYNPNIAVPSSPQLPQMTSMPRISEESLSMGSQSDGENSFRR